METAAGVVLKVGLANGLIQRCCVYSVC
uniref:Uncharacterized protein n=1 Tax=Anguilla anguilla TaxID=7936 RepID=A0A0E9PMB5_ANGAN